MPGTFTERQEGQCCWREVGKGAGRLDGVSGAAGDMVHKILNKCEHGACPRGVQ